MLYFILDDGNRIKAGKADIIEKRFRTLNGSNGASLILLFTIDLPDEYETVFHHYFKDIRVYDWLNETWKEWFHFKGELRDIFKECDIDKKAEMLSVVYGTTITPKMILPPPSRPKKGETQKPELVITHDSISSIGHQSEAMMIAMQSPHNEILIDFINVCADRRDKARQRIEMSDENYALFKKLNRIISKKKDVISKSIFFYLWELDAIHYKWVNTSKCKKLKWEKQWWSTSRYRFRGEAQQREVDVMKYLFGYHGPRRRTRSAIDD